MGLDQNLFRRTANGEQSEIYWRKANFVHWYFTHDWEERGFASDDCVEFPTDEAELRMLSAMCETVLEDKAQAEFILPTMSGFFFGSTDYDDWYFEDVKYTKDEIDKLLEERPLQDGEEFFYHAWY